MKKIFLIIPIFAIIIISGCIGQSSNYPISLTNSSTDKTYETPSIEPTKTNAETSANTYQKAEINYHNSYQGYSLNKPDNWEVVSSSGVIIIRKDADTMTAAIIYPIKLKADLSSSEILNTYFNVIRYLVVENGGSLEITKNEQSSAVFSGMIENQKISGKIFVETSGKYAVYKMYWSTDLENYESDLKKSIDSYEKSPEIVKPLKVNKGNYFSIPSPEGWKITETTNGIDAFDDEITGVSGAILVNAFGQTTPDEFIDFTIKSLGIADQELVSQGVYDSVSDNNGNSWYTKSKEFIYTYKGEKVRGIFSASITNGYGYAFSAMMTLRQSSVERWDEISPTLTQMERNFVVISSSQTTTNVKLPSNHPADSSSIMSSWEYRNQVEDRLSNKWQETIMGYENTISPSTGEAYQMPLNAYSETGPDGPGYYRPLANGFSEKLDLEY